MYLKTLSKIMTLLKNSDEAAEKLAFFLKHEFTPKNKILFKIGK